MYTFTESDWYTAEVNSLASEHQDLLVGTGHGMELEARPEWNHATDPGFIYLYEEIRINTTTTKLTHLRHLNWLASNVRERGWRLIWVATEVTGTPSQICVLWSAPDVESVETTLRDLAYEPPLAKRFAEMMLGIGHIAREQMYPESTEQIDADLARRGPTP